MVTNPWNELDKETVAIEMGDKLKMKLCKFGYQNIFDVFAKNNDNSAITFRHSIYRPIAENKLYL